MQRYRFNYRLLFGVVGGSVFVAAVAFFLVHPWQVDRKASWFLERANQAFEENDLRVAYDYQYKYVRYRSEEEEARVKLANIAADISDLDDVTREEIGTALGVLDDTVRRTSDAKLRRRLADMQIRIGRPQAALVHIQELLYEEPDNTEFQSLRVKALFLTKDFPRARELGYGLIGYDKQTKEFDAEKATAADQIEIYGLLAAILYEKSNTRDLSRRVIDRLVEVNPDSSEAHLKRSVFLYQVAETEEAGISLDRAYELAPTDSAVLLRKGKIALEEKEYDTAREFFDKALELYPEKIELYRLQALTEISRKRYEEAIAILDQGISRSDSRRSFQLRSLKIDLLFETKNLSAVKEEIDTLAKVKFIQNSALQPLVEFQRARIKLKEGNWAEAARELNRVRPLLIASPNEQLRAGFLLGMAYEKLGKFDLALESYNLVLQTQSKHAPAMAGRSRMRKRIRPGDIPNSNEQSLSQLVKEMLARPEDQQDWQQLDEKLVEISKKRDQPEYNLELQRAQVFLDRKMYSDAARLIQSARKLEPENALVRFAEVQLILSSPSGGPKQALDQLNKTVESFGPSIRSRTHRIEILLALGEEDVVEKLRALVDGTEEWDTNQQVQLLKSLAVAFQRLNLSADALKYMNRASKLAPNDLPLRMRLFDFAIQLRDEDAVREAQKQILEAVGNKSDATYIFTEVKRRLLGYSLEKVTREEMLEARGMLDTALRQRAEWSDLHVLYGQLLILLNEDMDLALQHLDDALKYGPANVGAVGLQTQILAKNGRFQEARKAMDRLPMAIRSKLLGTTEAEILLATGDKEGAYEAAKIFAQTQPDVVKTLKWFAKLAQQAGKLDSAAEAYEKSTALYPGDIDNWSQLLGIYVTQRKAGKVVEVFRRAQLSLDAEFLPILAAKAFELRGQWQHAEKIYLAGFSGRYEEVAIARHLADFYLRWSPSDPSYRQKAGTFINQILRATYEGKIPPDHPQAAWARIQAARQLAATKKYQDALKAQQLIEQGAVDGQLSVADRILLAEILASLNDPVSQGKSVRLLTELHENRQLQKKGILLLAQLLRNANQWERCEELILDSISTFGADVQVGSSYINMLIDRGDYTDARRRIIRLKQLDPQGTSYVPLQAKLAFEEGDKVLVRNTLIPLLPKNLKGALDANQLQAVRAAAHLATRCGDLELAEKLFQLLVTHPPKDRFELVQFQAMHGDTEKAMVEMKKLFPKQIDQVLALAAQMLRSRRDELGDRYVSDINRMSSMALRDDPDSAKRLLLKAELLEIQQNYQKSVEAYDKLLARDDVPVRIQAAAKNNLAFLLALLGERLEEAERFVEQAMEFFGPIDALLDTLALVKMASGQYDSAVIDLKLAVTVGRDPVKYYHLARAQLLAGDKEGALETWKVAKELGIDKTKLPLLEQPSYEKLEAELGP